MNAGVYTLANDAVIEWFQAFVRSFRKNNPSLPLTVIPYDQNMAQIQALQEQFHFEIMEARVCSKFDELAGKVKVSSKQAGCFRKFACFLGTYREFLFLDADIVTLVPLDRLLETFSKCPADFIYFDAAMEMCYKEKLAAIMVSQYGSPGYNSGAFFSRNEAISSATIFDVAEKASLVCDDFVATAEQPFINYVTDVSLLKCSPSASVMPEYAGHNWVRQPFTYDWGTDQAIDAKGKIMLAIHWAGCAFPTMLRPDEFLRYRTEGYSLPQNIRYHVYFYLLRFKILILKTPGHWKDVFKRIWTSSSWRKFYLCKLLGIKIELPSS